MLPCIHAITCHTLQGGGASRPTANDDALAITGLGQPYMSGSDMCFYVLPQDDELKKVRWDLVVV